MKTTTGSTEGTTAKTIEKQTELVSDLFSCGVDFYSLQLTLKDGKMEIQLFIQRVI